MRKTLGSVLLAAAVLVPVPTVTVGPYEMPDGSMLFAACPNGGQCVQYGTDTAGPRSITLTGVASGNRIMCAAATVGVDATSDVTSWSSDNGGALTEMHSDTAVGGSSYKSFWTGYLANTNSGTHVLTPNGTTWHNDFQSFICVELSGTDTGAPDASEDWAENAYATSASSTAAASLAQADELVIAWGVSMRSANTSSVIDNWGTYLEGADVNVAGYGSLTFEYQTVAATTGPDARYTHSNNAEIGVYVAAFKNAAGGASFVPGIINAPIRGGGVWWPRGLR